MYAVKLTRQPSGYDRWLEPDGSFGWSIETAALFSSMSQALQAIHTRGFKAANNNWSTGNDQLEVIEVENTPREKRVVS